MFTTKPVVIYLAIPIKFYKESMIIQSRLEAEGIIVNNPCTLIAPDVSKEKIPRFYAESCYEMIEAADGLVLFSDYYGRDCSTEVGYAIKSQKPVFPFSFSGKESEKILEDFMINPKVEPLSLSFDELRNRISSFFVKRDCHELENDAVHAVISIEKNICPHV